MMNREIVCARVAEIVADAERKFKMSFGHVSVGFFAKGASAGLAYCGKNRVEFNEILMARNSEDFDNTIIHEVAHLVTYKCHPNAKQSHGPEFKRVMQILGGVPNTYHEYDVSGLVKRKEVMRFEYKCSPECGNKFYVTTAKHNKIANGARFFCLKCKTTITPTGVSAKLKKG